VGTETTGSVTAGFSAGASQTLVGVSGVKIEYARELGLSQ
jgi:hypothetical protein